MDPAAQKRKRRGRRLVWLLVGVLIAMPIGGMLYATFGPNPPIVISKATTHITSPLDADGLPDYAAALLVDMKKGVTPENNGAVLFMRAMWPTENDPHNTISAENSRLLCRELGLNAPPDPSQRIGPFDTPENRLGVLILLRRLLPPAEPEGQTGYGETFDEFGISAVDSDALQDSRIGYVLYGCLPMSRPWTASDLPFLAKWFGEHQKQFDLLVEGIENSRWYLPPLARAGIGRGSKSIDLTAIQLARSSMHHLHSRSLLSLGEERFDDAFRDGFAIIRLGNHLAGGPLLGDRMVGNAITNIGYHLHYTLIDRGQASPETLRGVLQDLDKNGSSLEILKSVAKGERYRTLNAVVSAYRDGIAEPPELEDLHGLSITHSSTPTELVRNAANRFSVNWNDVLTKINQHYDQVDSSILLPLQSQKETALLAIDAERSTRYRLFKSTSKQPRRYLTDNARSQLLADAFLAEVGLAYGQCFTLDVRNQVQYDLLLLHLALAIHRDEQVGYPDTLDALVPGILPHLPVDPFNSEPYAYRQTDDGFLLYSLGPDGFDEGGSSSDFSGIPKLEGIEVEASTDAVTGVLTPYDPADQDLLNKIPAGADDVSLRIPLPVEPWPWEQ